MADVFTTIIGNCTRDPELKFTPGGLAVAELTLAVNERKRVNGTWQDGEPSFFDVTVFNQMAENVAECVNKGQRVVVSGAMRQDRWEDKKTGEKRSRFRLVADEVSLSLRFGTATFSKVERKATAVQTEIQESVDQGAFL